MTEKKQDPKLSLDVEHGADPTESETHAVDHLEEAHQLSAIIAPTASKKEEPSRTTNRKWRPQALLAIALAIGLAIFIPAIVLVTRDDDSTLEDTDKESDKPDEPEVPIMPVMPPTNNLCVNAQTITWDMISSLQGNTLTGTTALASILEEDYGYSRWNYDPNFGFAAGDLVDHEGRMCEWRSGTVGVWYKVMGRGTGIRASTCQQDGDGAHYLSVYQGSECGALNCVMNHPANCGGVSYRGARNTLSWFGEQDVTYYLYVEQQRSSSESAGEFTFNMTEICHSSQRHVHRSNSCGG